MIGHHPYAQRRDALDLGRQDVPRHPVRRDAIAHHAARLRTGVLDLDLVSKHRQVVRGRKPTWSTADHKHALAGARRGWNELPAVLQRLVTKEPLNRMDRHRTVQLGTVARGLTRVIANPPMDRRKRIVCDQHPPRLLVVASVHLSKPALDILPRRTRCTARREEIDIDRPLLAYRAGT